MNVSENMNPWFDTVNWCEKCPATEVHSARRVIKQAVRRAVGHEHIEPWGNVSVEYLAVEGRA
jgi:cob(I)alamin adenosyltransferase